MTRASDTEEIAALDRVLTRLVVTEETQLEKVLHKLVPLVLQKLSRAACQKKVLEILSHINKRVRAQPKLKLPTADLLALFAAAPDAGSADSAAAAAAAAASAQAAAMVRNFALVYLEMAAERADSQEQLAMVPTLLQGISQRPLQHQAICLRLIAAALSNYTEPPGLTTPAGLQQFRNTYGAALGAPAAAPDAAADATATASEQPSATSSANGAPLAAIVAASATVAADKALLLQHARRVMLYIPSTAAEAAARAAAEAAAAAASGGNGAAAAPPPQLAPAAPPGLCLADVQQLEAKSGPLSYAEAARRKAGLLAWLAAAAAAGLLQPDELLLHLLAAACDPSEPVSRRGDELLKRLCGLDNPVKPAVDLENPALVALLFDLFLGSAASGGSEAAVAAPPPAAVAAPPAAVAADRVVQPASVALRSRIVPLLCRSLAAANTFPQSMQVMTACLYGPVVTPRLKQQGMQLTVWVFKHAAGGKLQQYAPSLLEGLQRVLEETAGAGSDLTTTSLRAFAYQAIGSLAQRCPQLFSSSAEAPRAFFSALATEPQNVRPAVAEALGALASAYVPQDKAPSRASGGTDGSGMGGGSAAVLADIQALLLDSIGSGKDAVRLAAVQWALRLFPTTHAPSRFIAILGAGDAKPEVRDAALKGLGGSGGSSGLGAASSSGGYAYPAPSEMLAWVLSRMPRLGAPADVAEQLPLPPKAFQALIQFMEAARAQHEAPPPAATAAAAAAANASGGAADMEVEAGGAEAAAALAGHTPRATATAKGGPPEQKKARLSAEGDAPALPIGGGPPATSPQQFVCQYVMLLFHGCVRDAGREATGDALQALLKVAAADVDGFAADQASRLPWLRAHLLGHTDGAARLLAARLVGICSRGMESGGLQALLAELAAAVHKAAAEKVASRFEDAEGAVLAAGLVLAESCLKAPLDGGGCTPQCVDVQAQQAIVQALLALLPAGATPPSESAAAPAAAAASSSGGSSSSSAGGGHPALAGAAALSLGHIALAAPPALADDAPLLSRLLASLAALSADKDLKTATRAITAAGYVCYGLPTQAVLTAAWEQCLLKRAPTKQAELQFAVGQALALAFGAAGGGAPIAVQQLLRCHFHSLSELMPPAEEGVPPPPPAAAPPAAAATEAQQQHAAWQEQLLDKLLSPELVHHSRSEVRCSAAVWTVSLVSYCRTAPPLLRRLGDIQDALGGLLGDANELTQEMAGRGIGLVYGLGDEATRKQLVAQLVTVLQGGPKAKQAVKLAPDTQVFADGQLNTGGAGGGSSSSSASGGGEKLTTYKELCALATDLGKPELVYQLMDIAAHAQALAARKGAASATAAIARLALGGSSGAASGSSHQALLPGLDITALVPKLYRYQYDPNPGVAESMIAIWHQLVDDPRATIDAHFDAIAKELLREMGGRLWRSRQTSAAGLADLLQGRRWDQLGPHLLPAWSMTLRVMDDIKDSVRQAGLALARSLKSVTLRLTDAGASGGATVAAAVAAVLPTLLERGLHSSVVEVQALSLDTIAKLVKGAGAEAVRPHLPALVQSMLESLSGLENVQLNYIEQHAERLGLDNERLEGARVSASRSSPMADVLDLAARYAMCAPSGATAAAAAEPQTPLPGSVESLIPIVSSLIKRGVGLNTKVGAARFVRQLSMRHGAALRPASGELLRALAGALRSETSGTVRKAYAGAAAQLAKYAAPKRVEKLVSDALGWYSGSAGGGEGGEGGSDDARLVSALLLREMNRTAPEVFAGHAPAVLPLAYGARLDACAEVAATWGDVWTEGISSEAGAIRLYASEIVSTLVAGLGSAQWGRKQACAAAAASLAATAGTDLAAEHVALLVGALLAEAGGRLWEGKEAIPAALGALAQHCGGAVGAAGLGGRVVDALLEAAGRKKSSYRAAALKGLEAAIPGLKLDAYSRVAPPLLAACSEHCRAPSGAGAAGEASTASGAASAADTGGDKADGDKPLPLVECLRCLTAAWQVASADTQRAHCTTLGATLAAVLDSNQPWQSRLAALAAAAQVLKRAAPVAAAAAGPAAAASDVTAMDTDAPAPPAAGPAIQDTEASALIVSLLPGCLSSLDIKVQQVKQAALEVMAVVADWWSASGPSGSAASGVLAAARQRLEALAGSADEPSAAVKATAAQLAARLPAV